MQTQQKSDQKSDQPAETPANAPLATVPRTASSLDHPAASVLTDSSPLYRLEPRNFPELMLCAELAYKMHLGKVESVADAAVRMMRGVPLGLDVMTSCEQIYVVGDRTGMYARLMHALILRFIARTRSGGECAILEEESSDKIGIVRARRAAEDAPIVFKFTIEDAAKLVGKDKIDNAESNYNKDRKGMLIAKALFRACNRVWPDVVMGLADVDDLRNAVEHDERTGEVRQGAQAVPGAPARDWEDELRTVCETINRAKAAATATPAEANKEWASARDHVKSWTAPEEYRSRATAHYEQARKEWKEAQKAEAKA